MKALCIILLIKIFLAFTLLPSLTATAIPVSSIFISDNSTIEFSPIEIPYLLLI